MPPKAWSAKRERQYEHIKDGLVDQGRDTDTAEEIAARTVNKERARAGEAKESSRTSTRTSHRAGAAGCGPIVDPEAAPRLSSTPKRSTWASTAAPR